MGLNAIGVFCASMDGAREEYKSVATEVGRTLAQRGIGVVYGGASVGLMGAVADAALAAGGRVTGVMPQVLHRTELTHTGCTEVLVVDTMHARKAAMHARSDAFLVLPGGFGTLEELFEVLTWQVLRLHNKPVCLLNVSGFYDTLFAFLDRCVVEGVLRPKAREIVLVARTVDEALTLMEAAA